jgi:hypothetical protein
MSATGVGPAGSIESVRWTDPIAWAQLRDFRADDRFDLEEVA